MDRVIQFTDEMMHLAGNIQAASIQTGTRGGVNSKLSAVDAILLPGYRGGSRPRANSSPIRISKAISGQKQPIVASGL